MRRSDNIRERPIVSRDAWEFFTEQNRLTLHLQEQDDIAYLLGELAVADAIIADQTKTLADQDALMTDVLLEAAKLDEQLHSVRYNGAPYQRAYERSKNEIDNLKGQVQSLANEIERLVKLHHIS